MRREVIEEAPPHLRSILISVLWRASSEELRKAGGDIEEARKLILRHVSRASLRKSDLTTLSELFKKAAT